MFFFSPPSSVSLSLSFALVAVYNHVINSLVVAANKERKLNSKKRKRNAKEEKKTPVCSVSSPSTFSLFSSIVFCK